MQDRSSISLFGSSRSDLSGEYKSQVRQVARHISGLDVNVLVGITSGIVGEAVKEISKQNSMTKTSLITYQEDRYTQTDNVDKVIETADYFDRLRILCSSQCFVVFKGDLGTIAETIVAWNSVQASTSYHRKVLVFDTSERSLISLLKTGLNFSKREYSEVVEIHEKPDTIVTAISRALSRKL